MPRCPPVGLPIYTCILHNNEYPSSLPTMVIFKKKNLPNLQAIYGIPLLLNLHLFAY